MNLAVAVVMHQPQIREIIRTPALLGNHVMHVQVFAVFQEGLNLAKPDISAKTCQGTTTPVPARGARACSG